MTRLISALPSCPLSQIKEPAEKQKVLPRAEQKPDSFPRISAAQGAAPAVDCLRVWQCGGCGPHAPLFKVSGAWSLRTCRAWRLAGWSGGKREATLASILGGEPGQGDSSPLEELDIWQFSRLWPCDQRSGTWDLLSLVKGKSVPPKFLFQRPLATEPTAFPSASQDSLWSDPGTLSAKGSAAYRPRFLPPPDRSAFSLLGFLGLDPLLPQIPACQY